MPRLLITCPPAALLHQRSGALYGRCVRQDAADFSPTRGANAFDSLIKLRLVAAGYDHLGALDGQLARDLKADAGSLAGDDGRLVVQSQVHFGISHLHR
jgi:hypothetical protein